MKSFVLGMVALMVLISGAARAASATSTSVEPSMPLPPGMTPAMYKMMMTPKGPMHPAGMPAGYVPLHGCIPTMGYHYWNPKVGIMGPLYGWYNGKLTFTEYMPSPKQLNGTLFDNILRPLPGHTIDHIDIWPTPGHPGMMFPHFDIHAWYVPHEEHMRYCNPSGKHPSFISRPINP